MGESKAGENCERQGKVCSLFFSLWQSSNVESRHRRTEELNSSGMQHTAGHPHVCRLGQPIWVKTG